MEATIVSKIQLLVLLFFAVVVVESIRELSSVQVKSGTITRCLDPGHSGNNVIKTDVQNLAVPRWKVGRYKVVEFPEVCKVCKARNDERIAREKREAEERAERERREAEKQARINALKSKVSGKIVTGSYLNQETSLKPGDALDITLFAECAGDQYGSLGPINGLKILITPADMMSLDIPDDRADGFCSPDYPETVRGWKNEFRLLTTTGLPIGPLTGTFQWPPNTAWSNLLVLSRNAKPATDVMLNGYIIIEGEKLSIGTVVVHVRR